MNGSVSFWDVYYGPVTWMHRFNLCEEAELGGQAEREAANTGDKTPGFDRPHRQMADAARRYKPRRRQPAFDDDGDLVD